MLRQGHPATPHHREGERDPAADHQVGGVLGDKTTPRHEEREVDPVGNHRVGGVLAMRYQTWGLWLCDTRLGARPHHTEKEGEGGVLALRYQTGGNLLDPKVTRGVHTTEE